jgi:hypothetical protein
LRRLCYVGVNDTDRPCVAGGAVSHVSPVRDVPPADATKDPTKDIEARIERASGVLAVAHAHLVELTAEAIEGGLWNGGGIRSVAHWLTLKAGLSYARARQVADLAARKAELPATVDALSAGEVTFEQAHAVAAHTPAHADEAAARLARVTTVS